MNQDTGHIDWMESMAPRSWLVHKVDDQDQLGRTNVYVDANAVVAYYPPRSNILSSFAYVYVAIARHTRRRLSGAAVMYSRRSMSGCLNLFPICL